ncbi:AAA family ATPase [uncultured Arcobacter sp.]|uniref:AAA family ATPase n=1 Tax=uncultured Arcobacter sp. TaxID=165434 RepID=UPI00262D1066|nr:AAA family ATPase [uncultured Arcobacter sp.]
MLQNSDDYKKNKDKNLKLMLLSGIALIVLFFYTIYKSSSYIQSSTYSFGLVFIIFLLVFAVIARLKKDKIQEFINKNKIKDSVFEQELQKTKVSKEEVEAEDNSHIEVIKPNTTFKDIAGIASVKEELEEIVEFLDNPKKYHKYGIKLPKGVLLYGPPGVGKTLIARAVAGEANVPFFYQSGASFVQIYVGMGAKRVRELFAKAKANAPSIIFIDEIDAIGKTRSGKSNDERESTLNELLTQMDGFEGENGVIVIAATNKIEVLDDALLRAGRFDRRVRLTLPNIKDRELILELYLKAIKHTLDIKKLSTNLSGFSSASISTLINEAMLYMIKSNDSVLEDKHIEIAKNKLEFGKKENFVLSDNEKEILSIYQASKAFITKERVSLFDENSTNLKTIFPSKNELKKELKKYLSGSIGIEVLKDEQYAIFEEDLKKADDLAKDMVEKYAMAKDYKELIEQTKVELKTQLDENYDEINKLTKIMIEKEVIEKNEL